MADNFHIASNGNRSIRQMSLMGDFDGEASFQLVQSLIENEHMTRMIVITTSCLNAIHPNAREMLKKNLEEEGIPLSRIIFTGWNAELIAPKSTSLIDRVPRRVWWSLGTKV